MKQISGFSNMAGYLYCTKFEVYDVLTKITFGKRNSDSDEVFSSFNEDVL